MKIPKGEPKVANGFPVVDIGILLAQKVQLTRGPVVDLQARREKQARNYVDVS